MKLAQLFTGASEAESAEYTVGWLGSTQLFALVLGEAASVADLSE